MRILVIAYGDPDRFGGGLEKVVRDYSVLWASYGANVTIAFPSFGEETSVSSKSPRPYLKVPIRMPSFLKRKVFMIFTKLLFNIVLILKINKKNYDVININGENGFLFAGGKDEKCILLLHGAPGLYGTRSSKEKGNTKVSTLLFTKLIQIMIDYSAIHSRKVLSVSMAALDFVKNRVGRDDIIYQPNGIDSDFYKPVSNKSLVRKQLGFDEDKLTAIWVGRDPGRKGLELAINAVKSRKDMVLAVVGSTCKEYPDKIYNFPDATAEELLRLYQASDLYFLQSRNEGMSIALMEAMACGCVPIISKSAVIEGINDTTNTFVSDYLEDLDQIISRLLIPGTIDSMSVSARASTVKYSIDEFAASIFKIFQETVKKATLKKQD